MARSLRATNVLVITLAAAVAASAVPDRSASAQDVGEELGSLTVENARAYARPVGSGLGAAMNRGWFASARSLGAFEVELGLSGVAAIVPPEAERFEPVIPTRLTIPELEATFVDPYGSGQGVVTPTAAGQGAGARLMPQGAFRQALLDEGLDPDDFALQFPPGFDVPALPMAVLQASVGLPYGTQVTGRWLPSVEIDREIGEVRSAGAGLLHEVSRWVPGPVPVDVALGGGFQHVEVGDYLTADSRHATLVVSRALSALTLFAAGSVEATDYEVTYRLTNPRLPDAGRTFFFEDEGTNTAALTGGIRLELLFLRLDASYTLSDYDVLRAGLGVGF